MPKVDIQSQLFTNYSPRSRWCSICNTYHVFCVGRYPCIRLLRSCQPLCSRSGRCWSECSCIFQSYCTASDSSPFTGINVNYNEFTGPANDFPWLSITPVGNPPLWTQPRWSRYDSQSQFYLDVQDDSSSLSLPPFPDDIQFPTRTAFLDSMIATILDPPSLFRPGIWQTQH